MPLLLIQAALGLGVFAVLALVGDILVRCR
jgi:hypothetical protein